MFPGRIVYLSQLIANQVVDEYAAGVVARVAVVRIGNKQPIRAQGRQRVAETRCPRRVGDYSGDPLRVVEKIDLA